jgi:hypothetical protein
MLTVFIPMLKSILIREPLCLLWVVGLAMAWIQRHEQPKVSLLVALSLSLFLLEAVVGTYLDMWMPVLLYEHMQRLPAWLLGVLTFNQPVHLVVQTVAWGLLLFATFNWRPVYW